MVNLRIVSRMGKGEASNEVNMSDYDHYDIRPACKTSLGRINCDIYRYKIMPEVYLSMAYLWVILLRV